MAYGKQLVGRMRDGACAWHGSWFLVHVKVKWWVFARVGR